MRRSRTKVIIVEGGFPRALLIVDCRCRSLFRQEEHHRGTPRRLQGLPRGRRFGHPYDRPAVLSRRRDLRPAAVQSGQPRGMAGNGRARRPKAGSQPQEYRLSSPGSS